MKHIIKRYKPIARLIKDYTDKKSGKVSESRIEIQKRFKYIDWKDQKKILLAFLNSNKTDRQWAYTKALDYWDKSLEPKIKELWTQYHEEKCSWVIIHNFPADYLRQNIDEFTHIRNYFFICLRLAKTKDFVIDKEKLSHTDYLAVLFHNEIKIEENEAKDILYSIIHDICVGEDLIYDSDADIIEPSVFKEVNLALYYLQGLNCLQTISQFHQWNSIVIQDITNSKEFNVLPINDICYRKTLCCKIAKKYAYLVLDDKYKKKSDPPIESVIMSDSWFNEKLQSIDEKKQCLNEMENTNYNIKEIISDMEFDIPDFPFENMTDIPF